MDTIRQLQNIIIETIKAQKPCDIRYATIKSIEPLSITLENVQLVIESPAVEMIESCKELTIDDFKHNHSYYDSDTGEGASGSATRTTDDALININCYLNGEALGKTQDGKIIIRKGLAVGDKVAVIRANGGQQYLIMGRV